MKRFNINMFLLLGEAENIRYFNLLRRFSIMPDNFIYKVKYRHGLLDRLQTYFWREAQRNEIDFSGIFAGESMDFYYIYFNSYKE